MITDKVGGSSAKPEVSKQSKEKRLKHKVSGYKSQSKRRSIAGCRLLLRTLSLLFENSTNYKIFCKILTSKQQFSKYDAMKIGDQNKDPANPKVINHFQRFVKNVPLSSFHSNHFLFLFCHDNRQLRDCESRFYFFDTWLMFEWFLC